MVSLNLPYPPSVNHYLGRSGSRSFLGPKAVKFISSVIDIVRNNGTQPFNPEDRLFVQIILYPPDNRRRDIDNSIKVCLDSLMRAKVIPDDSQIDRLSVVRKEVIKGGNCIVFIDKIQYNQDTIV